MTRPTDETLLTRLAALRAQMEETGLSAFIVPRSDAFQNEYVAPCDERLQFLTGFTGSAGFAVVTPDRAAMFVDGRYTIQAAAQVPATGWEHCKIPEQTLGVWLRAALQAGDNIGFDARLHTMAAMRDMAEGLAAADLGLIPLAQNPIDAIWTDRPGPPMGQMTAYPLEFAGESVESKLDRVSAELDKAGCDGLVISSPECLAWLTNTRGSDLAMVPVTFGQALLSVEDGLTVYLEPEKTAPEVAMTLAEEGVAFAAPEALDFAGWGGKRLRFDQATASVHLVTLAEAQGVQSVLGADPITLMKACKSEAEQEGFRAAHLRDGAAVTKFWKWFAEDRPQEASEWDADQALAGFRAALERFQSPSFDTISAAGPSAALAHYRATEDSAQPIKPGQIYLNDSGGQFLDGTTDVTRTSFTSDPSDEMRLRYTQVLKGHVALMRQRFPKGVTGGQLDSIARMHLWQEGVDFDHGTGHGVGHYLSVHEGPMSISKRGSAVALEPGMVVSIEPGFYKEGAFGIRIENLVIVRQVAAPPALADRVLYEFENLTYVPYERGLMDVTLLSPEERDWIDAYHAQVRRVLSPQMQSADLAYLERMTAPLA